MGKGNQKIQIIMSINQIDEIKNCISRYLGIREHSKTELFDKLFKKNFNQIEIEECILDFETKGLQSDERYAQRYVESKYKAQKGPRLIESNLIKNGVNKKIINDALLSYTKQDWENSAIIALEKKTFSKKTFTDKIKVEKQKIFLMSRGFGYHIIEKAINRFWKL